MTERIPLDDLTSDQLDQLYDERDRYRLAWQSARHRAAMYLKSNRNFAASLDNGHAVQLHAEQVARSAASSAATALTHQLAAEHRAEQAEAAIERVRAIHSRGTRTNACNDCGQPWPCELTRALDEAQQPTTTEAPAVTIHACPGPDDNGISPCCHRPPFEFRTDRITRDPAHVTCPGPEQQTT